ncbi:hypothetical protein GNF83_14345, partial [Clostridium perfringens]|nr:hypothetical protein [Clostridium perfringens]
MVVEKYIKELKENNDIKSMKVLVREYDKQINFYKSNKILEGKRSRYVFNLLLICISIFLLFFGQVSIFIKLFYSMPLFIVSIIALILDLKVREDKFSNRKLLYKSAIYFFVLIFLMSFTIIYIFQIILFRNWKDIDYIKSIILLISFLIPIIIATVYDSPKRFLKEFANTNRKYRG